MKLVQVIILLLCFGLTNISMSNKLVNHDFAVDHLYRAESEADFQGETSSTEWSGKFHELVLVPGNIDPTTSTRTHIGAFVSKPIKAEFPFHELLPSWNIFLNEFNQGYRISIRISDDGTCWSSWYHLGGAGILAKERQRGRRRGGPRERTPADEWGSVDNDYLMTAKPCNWFQYKVELASQDIGRLSGTSHVGLKRFFVSYSNTAGDEKLYSERVASKTVKGDWATSIPIPYRNQLWVAEKRIRGSICCPTCVSMVLEGYGVDKRIATVAREAYDVENGIYGTWPRASQAAAKNGMIAWVDRFRNHDSVKQMIANGIPVMASIRIIKGDMAESMPERTSNGHLILVRGFTENGDYVVNDPYVPGPDGAEIVFPKADMEKVWFNKGGVGIVIVKPESSEGKKQREYAHN